MHSLEHYPRLLSQQEHGSKHCLGRNILGADRHLSWGHLVMSLLVSPGDWVVERKRFWGMLGCHTVTLVLVMLLFSLFQNSWEMIAINIS